MVRAVVSSTRVRQIRRNERASFLRTQILRVLCLGTSLMAPTIHADGIALGGAYSLFGEWYIVATGASDTQNCDNLRATITAMAGFGTAKLPPATYDCATTQLNVPTGVTLEGSGQQTTKIIGQVGSAAGGAGAPVFAADGAELYNLTVQNTVTNTAGGAAAILPQ